MRSSLLVFETDKAGRFAFAFVPTGAQMLRAQTAAGEMGVRKVKVSPDSREEVDILLPMNRNLIGGINPG